MNLTKEQSYLFEKLRLDRESSYWTFTKPSMKNANRSIIDKYSEPAHFILELLQNADDVGATNVWIKLLHDRLIFKHNGIIRFTLSDVDYEYEDTISGKLGHINSITSIGNSNKEEEENKIGKFGIGFKSIFKYCDEPEIYDSPFSFKIKNMFVPKLLDPDLEIVNQNYTKFVLPFKNKLDGTKVFNDIKTKLESLAENILILNNINEIEWFENDNYGIYIKNRESKKDFNIINILYETNIESVKNSIENNYLQFENFIDENIKLPPVSIIFQFEKNKLINNQYHPFCYFPIRGEQKLFNFILQAPFKLLDSRERINFNDDKPKSWNENLIFNLSKTLTKSLSILKRIGFLTYESFNVFPIRQIEADKFNPIINEFQEVMKSSEELLPTNIENKFTSSINAVLARSEELVNLFDNLLLKKIFNQENLDWIDRRVTENSVNTKDIWSFFTRVLKIRVITPKDIFEKLDNSIFNERNDEWFQDFYELLFKQKEFLKHEKSLIGKQYFGQSFLSKNKIIKLKDDSLIEPYKVNGQLQCYLPSTFKTSINLVKQCFIDNEDTKQFLEFIGIKEYDILDEIYINVIPKYKKDSITLKVDEIFEDNSKIYTALNSVKKEQRDTLISTIKQLPIIIGKKGNDSKYQLCIPDTVYLSKELTENKEIEDFFEEINILNDIIFISIKFAEIYKNDITILMELGCIGKFQLLDEVQNRILKKYSSENIIVSDQQALCDMKMILEVYKKFNNKSYSWRYGSFLNIIREKKLVKCKNIQNEVKWQNGSKTYSNSVELKTLFNDLSEVFFVDNMYGTYQDEMIEVLKINNTLKLDVIEADKDGITILSNYHGSHRRSFNGFDPNAQIEFLDKIIRTITVDKFIYLWDFLKKYHFLISGEIEYSSRKDFSNSNRENVESTLGKILKNNKWIPNKNGNFFKPSEIILSDFLNIIDKESIEEIKFAKKLGVEGNLVTDDDAKRVLGITDSSLEIAKKIESLSPDKKMKFFDKQKSLFDEIENEKDSNFPISSTPNPVHRTETVKNDIAEAAPIETIIKDRQVRISSNNKSDPKIYLNNFYTNSEEQLICQICEKEMPFTIKDGSDEKYYFEYVQIFDGNEIINVETEYNYLALCPVCSAKYNRIKKGDDNIGDIIKKQIISLDINDISDNLKINLPTNTGIDPPPKTIRFVQKHLIDIQAIL
jgi:hypothetical protein